MHGGFLAFYRALSRLTWPLIALGFLIGLVQRGRAAYSRLEEVYDAEPDIVDGPLPAPATVEGRLEVENLALRVQKRAGAGRRELRAAAGQVARDRRAHRQRQVDARRAACRACSRRRAAACSSTATTSAICRSSIVRSTIGYAQQTAFLFSTTVGRNIGYVLDDPDSGPALKTIREAAAEARILDEVLGLPDGFDTVVGERGVQLSGGQKQRVALARAFVSQPQDPGARRSAERGRRPHRES